MKLLVVGGTAFVGRAISLAALERGHELTVFNRGRTSDDLPASVERLVGDRRDDLRALAERHFDATIDVIAYRASDVERLAETLGDRGGHHLHISSISAYRAPESAGATEATLSLCDAADLDPEGPITNETYGPFKAAAEQTAASRFGPAVTIVRPTFVIGAHDETLRFPYWVERLRRGGDVVVPSPRTNPLQYVDARDLAAFCIGLLESGVAGAFHVAGTYPPQGFSAVIEAIAVAVAPAKTRILEVELDTIVAANLEDRFPLWGGPEPATLLQLDSARARAAGFRTRPLADSVTEVRTWWGDRPWPDGWLRAEDESRLLAESS